MSEFAEAQGNTPVKAMRPVSGDLAVGVNMPAPKPKSVSADSFRKLTALLKKETTIPNLTPQIAPPVEPTPIELPEVIPPAVVETKSVELPETIAPTFVEVAPVALPETVAPIVVEAVPETIEEPAPRVETQVFAEVAEPEYVEPAVEPELIEQEPVVEEPPPLTMAQILAEIKVPEPAFVPEVAPPPQLVETTPLVTRPGLMRARPRDAFAQVPKIPASKPVVPAPIQTPEQELESAELARSLLDMMASSNSSGLPQERALAADTLLRMLSKLPLKSLIMLAERLCMMDAPPQLIVAKLISDPRIEVSGPLLENCMHISDEVLIGVIHEGSVDKRRMMARRRRISRAVSAQLALTDDASVLLTLVRNANAEVAHESFIDLVHSASHQTELLAPLCIRADLPVTFAFELFWLAPAQLRRYLLSRFLTDSETLTKILKIAMVTNSDEAAETSFPNPDRIREALQLYADGQTDEGAKRLGECAQIAFATAERILADRQGDPLAALLKAAGVPRSEAEKILEQAVSAILDPERDPEELKSLFDSLSFNKARILLTYWDWATLQTGPYAPLN